MYAIHVKLTCALQELKKTIRELETVETPAVKDCFLAVMRVSFMMRCGTCIHTMENG